LNIVRDPGEEDAAYQPKNAEAERCFTHTLISPPKRLWLSPEQIAQAHFYESLGPQALVGAAKINTTRFERLLPHTGAIEALTTVQVRKPAGQR
jgi:hypothetical protein